MRDDHGGQHFAVDPVVLDRVAAALHDISGDLNQAKLPIHADTMTAAAALHGWATGSILTRLAEMHESSLTVHSGNLTGLGITLRMAAADYRAADAASANSTAPR